VIILIVLVSALYLRIPKENEIKVGVTVALSGSAASLGQDAKDGMLMALEELESQGISLSLIYEDDQYDVEKTVSAFHKLVYVDRVKYIVTFGSGNSIAVCSLAEENEIFHIAIASDLQVLEYDFTIKVGSDPGEFGRALAEEVIRRGYQRIYVLASNYPAILAFVDEFKNREGISGRIIGEAYIDPAETDFRTVLLKTRESNPDSLLLEIVPGRVGLLAKQARDLNIDVPLFAAGVFEDQSAIDSATGALEGQWFVNPEVSESFVERFQSRFNRIPGREVTNGYDSIMLLGEAIKAVGDDPEKVNDYLHQITEFDSDSVVGGIRVEAGNFIKTAVVKLVINDTFVLYEEQNNGS